MYKFFLALMLAFVATVAQAGEALPTAADPELEKRVMALSEELRCLVCQNQTLADSHAELAMDLKGQVREKLASGMSEGDVVEFMVERYGDFVLYRPPVKGTTWVLWFGPFLLLFGGVALLLMKLARRPKRVDDLAEPDMLRAAALLDSANQSKEKA